MGKDDSEDIGEGFSSVDLIYQCLIDEDKFDGFKRALQKVITPTSRVLEFGTGSGILSMLSAQLGAAEVTAVEFDPFVADIARNNIKQNDLDTRIQVLTGDAREITFEKPFDVVVMEMLATGLVDEMQVLAINNLCQQGLITDTTHVVPYAQENYVALAHTDFNIHGFTMPMISHLWSHDDNEGKFKLLSGTLLLNAVKFTQVNSEDFSGEVTFEALSDGEINSICLSSKVLLDAAGTITLGATSSLSPLVLIPLPPRKVSAGETLSIAINYTFGGGFKNFHVTVLDHER